MKLRGDIHVHTTASDGKASPAEVVLEAVERGLDFVAITDHDTFEGGLRARLAADSMQLDLVVIVGNEVRTDRGDVLVLCPDKVPKRVPASLPELIEVAHGHGCLAIPAHPFDLVRKGVGEGVYRHPWDAVEVYNARSPQSANKKAQYAAKLLGLPGVAGSDAHLLEELGVASNIVEADSPNAHAILEAIRRGRVTPVPGRRSIGTVVRSMAWSIERRVRKRSREPEEYDVWHEYGR
ncbi:MAG: PHP domain-containing protein [Thermoproteota archaeon]